MNAVSPDKLKAPEEARRLELALAVVQDVARELHPELPGLARLGADASIERDFGLDSLARVELANRLERATGARISHAAIAQAETVRELARALGAPAAAAAAAPVLSANAPGAGAAPQPRTLVEALEWHAREEPQRAHILLADRDTAEPVSYAALRAAALALAGGLLRRGIGPGEPVAIMLPTGRDFFAAFYGVLYARAVPVPLYPPARPSQIESHLRRVAGILNSCAARLLVTFEGARAAAKLLGALSPHVGAAVTVAELTGTGEAAAAAPALRPSDAAFLQYTSGSTGQPKGVVLSHEHLLANLSAMQKVTQITSEDCFVSWLPLYHDMGLIGACMGALVFGYPLVLMSPFAFLTHPVRWLKTIERHRATITAAPNFAYEICTAKVSEEELASLHLDSLRLVFNGAETVSARTLERFAARFARCGLSRTALMPVYGLAEGALGLTFPPLGRGPVIDRIDRERFLRTGSAQPTQAPEPAALPVVSCGSPLPGYSIRIVDARGHALAERTQGRIQFQGPSATSGYLNNPAETARLFDGRWLNSGDLGYLAAGELYVTGRTKDIIIRGGHNIHPQELEEAIGRLPGVRKGGVVVFAAADRRRATERVVALVETAARGGRTDAELVARINRLGLDLIGMPIDDVVLAPPRTVLKTSSGKIRRAACREAYEQGRLGAAGRPPWLQLARLRLSAVAAWAARGGRHLAATLWGVWALLVAAVLAPPSWLLILVVPGLLRRRVLAAAGVRLAMRLAGVSLQVRQPAHPGGGQRMYVSNHASYLDAVALITVLPPEVTFVAAGELERTWLLGPLLRRLGCLFVERHDVQGAVAAGGHIEARLRARESLCVFAEGTFQRDPGLLPFHMGAFLAAASAGVPVVPVAVCGTRAMLPDGSHLPRPAPLAVALGEPVTPRGSGWEAALALRNAARGFILGQTHEPDLEQAARSAP